MFYFIKFNLCPGLTLFPGMTRFLNEIEFSDDLKSQLHRTYKTFLRLEYTLNKMYTK